MTAQAPPLAAMIGTLAEVDAAQKQGKSWNAIAAQFGYPSGRQAKKLVHALKAQVRQELAAMAGRHTEATVTARSRTATD